ncbi:murein biosynthesis integral membrane protein MurJ [Candidatus Peregrinibacteria bacterium]|nr:murein biosynthesis integral membrane protein MurJ [Candidatus Peregrinibacteria bacterium]
MRKFFKPIGIGGASALISVTSLLSYIIGLFRDRIIAVNFGTSDATDTFYASFLIPDMLFNLFIAGALSAAFLPVFTHYLGKDKKEAQIIASTMLTGASILIIFLAVISFIFMESIIPIAFPDASPTMQNNIINVTRLILPSAILFAISNTLGNILMSYRHFLAYSLSPILYNFGIILGVSIFADKIGIYSAAIGVLIGATMHCAMRIFDIFNTDYRYEPKLELRHPGFKKILKLMIPKSISLIAWQLNLYIYAVIGIRIIEGGLAAFNFARNIQSVAVSLFGIAFATAVFPHLTSTISENNKTAYTEHIRKTAQRILFFTVPAMVGVALLADPIVALILKGGVFNEKSVEMTSVILLYFAISIPFESLVHILARAFYAMQNTLKPMLINITAMTIIALITIFIAPKFGYKWFSIGFSIGLMVQVLLLTTFLSRYMENFKLKEFSKSLGKTALASVVMAITIYFSFRLGNIITDNILTVMQIAIGGAIYLITAALLKSKEITSIKYVLDRIFKKSTYEKTD